MNRRPKYGLASISTTNCTRELTFNGPDSTGVDLDNIILPLLLAS